LCQSDLQACQTDSAIGRRENHENSDYTSCRRDQDFFRIPCNSILWSSPYGISLLEITGYAIIEVRWSVLEHDALKKSTMDKTLEIKLKSGMNAYCRLVMKKES
jgi:hypothetical protein